MERYVIDANADLFYEEFRVTSNSESLIDSSFNASTGHLLPMILQSGSGNRTIEGAIWGLTYGPKTVATISLDDLNANPGFRDLLKSNACIIPVSGFYVWKKTTTDPLPFYARIHSEPILAIAGMWKEVSESRKAFVPIVKSSNVLLKPLSDTMPCILDKQDMDAWLSGSALDILSKGFMHNEMMPDMTVFRVPNLVNDVSNNSKELIQPIPKLRDED